MDEDTKDLLKAAGRGLLWGALAFLAIALGFLAVLLLLAPSARAEEADDATAVESEGDIDPEWTPDGKGMQAFILWKDANGNYSVPTNGPLAFKSDVAELNAAVSESSKEYAKLAAAAREIEELVDISINSYIVTPVIASTLRATSFKLSLVIDTATFRFSRPLAWGATTNVEERTVTIDGVQTSVLCRQWYYEYATTDALQTIVPDVWYAQQLDGVVDTDDMGFLLPSLVEQETVTGDAVDVDGSTYNGGKYRLTMWIPNDRTSGFVRLHIDGAEAAPASGDVWDVPGVKNGYSGTVEWGSNTIRFLKGPAVYDGSAITTSVD